MYHKKRIVISLKDKISLNKLPSHLAVIMDGNGRWAKSKGKFRVFGHKNGVKSVREITEGCAELGIKYLTLYAFSTENWNRPKTEVSALMNLLVDTIGKELKTLTENNIKLKTIGDISKLPDNTRNALLDCIENTKDNTRMTLILALNYSSRWELVEATKSIAQKVNDGELSPENIDENTVNAHLSTAGIPDPELMIRTSGELRISNYLLWQLAYSELYFTDVMWPDFSKEHLYEALIDFQKRERRFGQTSDQISINS